MRASASVAAELVDGRLVLRELRSDPPLTVRATLDGVHLVGSGAGPLGGDDLRLRVRVGDGARLRVASVAATLAQPGPSGAPSSTRTWIELGRAARLDLRPEPVVLVRGCDHRTATRVRLGADATLVWRDVVVLGRHDEPSGSVRQRLDVEQEGRALLRTEVNLGPRWPGSDGPAGVGRARAVGTLLLVGAPASGAAIEAANDADDPATDMRAAALELDDGSALVSVVGPSPATVVALLDRLSSWPTDAPSPERSGRNHPDRRA